METSRSTPGEFDETQSLKVIQEMISVSQIKIRKDGILLIVWGYAGSLPGLLGYFRETLFLPNRLIYALKFADWILPIFALLFTIYYVVNERKKVVTYIGASLRYVWFSLFGCMVLTNLIIYNLTREVNFNLQHPLFMVLTAFAILVTGVILRYKPIIWGGILFGVLAYWASFVPLLDQMLIKGLGWFLALAVPGHILYYKRNQ